jgi:hypothetical protein
VAGTQVAQLTLGEALDLLVSDFALPETAIAEILGVSSETVADWRSRRAVPEGEAARRLVKLQALRLHLRDTFDAPDAIPTYLRTNLPFLGGMSPLDALVAGDIDRAEAALDALDAGIFV